MRYCEFGNAMLNFRKMRASGDQRSFERGFLAAGCGYSSPENIGINVYNPDIVSGTCDFIFNETVVVYSHTNIEITMINNIITIQRCIYIWKTA